MRYFLILCYNSDTQSFEDMKLEDGKTYQVAISGISEKLASETEVTDSGIVGMDAAKEFLGQFKTLSEADAEWK